MRAYRVNLIGTQDHYLITERQKPSFEAILKSNKSGVVSIGGDIIRSSAIKSIKMVNVDTDSCPDYFIEAVKREGNGQTTANSPEYRKLPTKWLILDMNGKIIADNIGRATVRKIAKIAADNGTHFRQAKCHYRVGTTNEPEYITNITMIPDALEMTPSAECTDGAEIVGRTIYGQSQW